MMMISFHDLIIKIGIIWHKIYFGGLDMGVELEKIWNGHKSLQKRLKNDPKILKY